MVRTDYNSYLAHKSKCENAHARGEFCLTDWNKAKLLLNLEQSIESMELNQEYYYLNPICRAIKSRGINTLNELKRDLAKKYKKEELQDFLLTPTDIYRTGNRLRHTRFYKIIDHKRIMEFICSYYKAPKPVQLKLNLATS